MAEGFKFEWVVVRSADKVSVPKPAGIGAVIAGPSATPRGVVLAGNARGAVPARPKAEGISVSKERLSFGETRELMEESTTIGAAPILPMMLIRPSVSKVSKPPKKSAAIAASGADKSEFDGTGVTVAVLDTGIDKDHPAFKGVKIIQQNFTQGPPNDIDGHGTHCAGTIFGRDVSGTRIGIARGVQTALIAKVIDTDGGSTESIVRAVQWAQAMGADVISMSLGMDFVGYLERLVKSGIPQRQATALTLEGFRLNILMFASLARTIGGQIGLVDGSVTVAAAGNASNAPEYTIAVEAPANSEGFVSVAALDKPVGDVSRLASFSNVGAKLAAPGVDIWSAKLGGGLVAMSGTSMATPAVAGIACLWTQKLKATVPHPTSQDVVSALRTNAMDLTPDIARTDVEWGQAKAPRD